MADITHSRETIGASDSPVGGGYVSVFTWANMGDDHEGSHIVVSGLVVDMVFQAVAADWDSADLSFEGSNDGTNWFALADAGGTVISAVADGFYTPGIVPLQIRPVTANGQGSTDVTVTLVLRTAG